MRMIPLDIAMDYPISWSFSKILRDLIQNFYDSIGAKNFDKEFYYTWHEQTNDHLLYTLEMKTENHPFSYEWLTAIGGSTKTNAKNSYIGMYGEGFKMCMLCLEAKTYLEITMESQDWCIEPCQYTKEIDGQSIAMLGYNLTSRKDDGWTRLVIKNISCFEMKEVEAAKLNFFYPQNPLFGEKISENESYAIYDRSKMPIPYRFNDAPEGILFFNKLARGDACHFHAFCS